MSLVARTAGVAMLGFAVVACGGGDGGDEGAIKNVFRDFFRAFEDGDASALAGLLSDDCEDAEERATEALDDFHRRLIDVDVDFKLTGVDIRELTERTAEVMPEGVSIFDGEESPLGSEGGEYATIVKINGEWKFAECDFLFGT